MAKIKSNFVQESSNSLISTRINPSSSHTDQLDETNSIERGNKDTIILDRNDQQFVDSVQLVTSSDSHDSLLESSNSTPTNFISALNFGSFAAYNLPTPIFPDHGHLSNSLHFTIEGVDFIRSPDATSSDGQDSLLESSYSTQLNLSSTSLINLATPNLPDHGHLSNSLHFTIEGVDFIRSPDATSSDGQDSLLESSYNTQLNLSSTSLINLAAPNLPDHVHLSNSLQIIREATGNTSEGGTEANLLLVAQLPTSTNGALSVSIPGSNSTEETAGVTGQRSGLNTSSGLHQDSTSQGMSDSDFERPERSPDLPLTSECTAEEYPEQNHEQNMSEASGLYRDSTLPLTSEDELTFDSEYRLDKTRSADQDHSFNLEGRLDSEKSLQVERRSTSMWRLASRLISAVRHIVWPETPLQPDRVKIENRHHTVPETTHQHEISESQVDPIQEQPDYTTDGSLSTITPTQRNIMSTYNLEPEVQQDNYHCWEPSNPNIPNTLQSSTPGSFAGNQCQFDPMSVTDSYVYERSEARYRDSNLAAARTYREIRSAVVLEANSIAFELTIRTVSSKGLCMADVRKQMKCSAENLLITFAAIYIESENAPQILQNINSAIKYCREGLRSALPESLKEFADLINVQNTLSVLVITSKMCTGYIGLADACLNILEIIGLPVLEMVVKTLMKKFGSNDDDDDDDVMKKFGSNDDDVMKKFGSNDDDDVMKKFGSNDDDDDDVMKKFGFNDDDDNDVLTKTAAMLLMKLVKLLIGYLQNIHHD